MITTINEYRKIYEEANFPSQFDVDDTVSFRPMFKHQQEFGIADEYIEGRIVAVRFTAAKVFYDIVDTYYGKLFDNVDSIKVRPDVTSDKNSNINDAGTKEPDIQTVSF